MFKTKLLSTNYKTRKGEGFGFITKGIHFAPANLSGYEVCKYRSKGCTLSCLNYAGRGQMSSVQIARVKRTVNFHEHTQPFMEKVEKEIKSTIKSAQKNQMIACFRPNLTSDVNWAKVLLKTGKNLFDTFPHVQFYDYTKDYQKVLDNTFENYHLTFSLSETEKSKRQAIELIEKGFNVAVVFSVSNKKKPLPKEYTLGNKTYPVIDGDEHDLRFLDRKGAIVGLRAKGRAKQDTSKFVVAV